MAWMDTAGNNSIDFYPDRAGIMSEKDGEIVRRLMAVEGVEHVVVRHVVKVATHKQGDRKAVHEEEKRLIQDYPDIWLDFQVLGDR